MIEAVIFDMDGVLIDSEPFWKEAEQKVFKTVGINLNDELCKDTTGLDGISTIRYWYDRRPWSSKSFEQIKQEIEAQVLTLVSRFGHARDGVKELLEYFTGLNIKIAVASSSPYNLIESVTRKIGIRNYFQIIQSSETEKAGKPNPAVYLAAAKKLGVDPALCLAFEDSINGLTAAQKAGMKTVAIPDPHLFGDIRYNSADLVVHSLKDFGFHHFQFKAQQ